MKYRKTYFIYTSIIKHLSLVSLINFFVSVDAHLHWLMFTKFIDIVSLKISTIRVSKKSIKTHAQMLEKTAFNFIIISISVKLFWKRIYFKLKFTIFFRLFFNGQWFIQGSLGSRGLP